MREEDQRGLSEREFEIAGLLADGLTNLEVAGRLMLSVRTVEWRRARLQMKLGETRSSELVLLLKEWGMEEA